MVLSYGCSCLGDVIGWFNFACTSTVILVGSYILGFLKYALIFIEIWCFFPNVQCIDGTSHWKRCSVEIKWCYISISMAERVVQ